MYRQELSTDSVLSEGAVEFEKGYYPEIFSCVGFHLIVKKWCGDKNASWYWIVIAAIYGQMIHLCQVLVKMLLHMDSNIFAGDSLFPLTEIWRAGNNQRSTYPFDCLVPLL